MAHADENPKLPRKLQLAFWGIPSLLQHDTVLTNPSGVNVRHYGLSSLQS